MHSQRLSSWYLLSFPKNFCHWCKMHQHCSQSVHLAAPSCLLRNPHAHHHFGRSPQGNSRCVLSQRTLVNASEHAAQLLPHQARSEMQSSPVIWCSSILQGREAPRAMQGARSCRSSGIQAANLQATQLQHSGHRARGPVPLQRHCARHSAHAGGGAAGAAGCDSLLCSAERHHEESSRPARV